MSVAELPRLWLCHWLRHPSGVHPHLIMINATQLPGEESYLALKMRGGEQGAAVVVVLALVAGTTAEPKRHATCCIVRGGKRHSNVLAETPFWFACGQHTHAHNSPPPPTHTHSGICVACAACGQPDKKALYGESSAPVCLSLSHDCCACPAPPPARPARLTGRRMYLRRWLIRTGPKWKVAPPTNYAAASP